MDENNQTRRFSVSWVAAVATIFVAVVTAVGAGFAWGKDVGAASASAPTATVTEPASTVTHTEPGPTITETKTSSPEVSDTSATKLDNSVKEAADTLENESAAPSTQLYLADIKSGPSVSTKTIAVSGKAFTHAVSWEMRCYSDRTSREWILNRDWSTLSMEVGIGDEGADPSANITVEAYLDDSSQPVVLAEGLKRDKLVPVELDTSGKNRLTLVASSLEGSRTCGSRLVLGDAKLTK